jgi:hypothetical protein
MAMIEHNPTIDRLLQLQEVEQYLTSHGWQLVAHPNQKLRVFAGPPDNDGQPIRLALPLTDNLSDSNLRLYQAIQTIAEVEDRSPSIVIADIEKQAIAAP